MLRTILLVLLAVSCPAWAEDNADTVNERIPVSRQQLEAHWQVDCAATWQSVLTVVEDGDDCRLPAALSRQLQLCAFIYQAPGNSHANCPDFRGALQSGGDDNCRQLAELARPCPGRAAPLNNPVPE